MFLLKFGLWAENEVSLFYLWNQELDYLCEENGKVVELLRGPLQILSSFAN